VPLTRAQYKVIAALILVMALTICQSVAYYQNSDIGMVWIDHDVNLNFWGFRIPVAWFNSIDPLASMLAVPVLLSYWRSQAVRGREPGEVGKIAIGAWIACGANLLLVAGCAFLKPVPAIIPVVYDTLLGIAFLYYWPTLLALVSREAPPRVRATLMGTAFLSLALADVLVGQIGTLYGHMTPLQFWAFEAAIAALGAVVAMLLTRPLERVFATNVEHPAQA
jgi:proton-dependent oligopeptide transporter, POT family